VADTLPAGPVRPPTTLDRREARRPSTGLGWRWFITPRHSVRRGTMPAGAVLAIVVPALVVGMFLNAPATLRKSSARDKGEWRRSVAESVEGVSSALRLDAPRRAIDDRLRQTDDADQNSSLAALVAEQRAATTTVPGAPTTPPRSAKPTLRTPTLSSKLKIWVGGDSQMQPVGPEARPVFEGSGLFTMLFDYKPSSGLTRPDYLNWPKRLVEVATNEKPDVMVLLFGANDAQAMPIPGSGGYPLYSPEWLTEYRNRVATTMDLLRSPTDDRLIVWIGALPMGPNSGVKGMDKLDEIYSSEARRRPWVTYVDPVPLFTDTAGNYGASLPAASGKVQLLRASDNIHLTWAGARRLVWAVYARLGEQIDLQAAQGIVPPADDLPAKR